MKLNLTPENSSYSAEQRSEVKSVDLDGGMSRYRRDILGAAFIVDTTFVLDGEQYEYLQAFFRTGAGHGSLPFEIDLIIDEAAKTEYTAYFYQGRRPKLNSQQGLGYFVSAQLEVYVPLNPTEADDDTDIIDAFNTAHGFS